MRLLVDRALEKENSVLVTSRALKGVSTEATEKVVEAGRNTRSKSLSVEWLGQTAASLLWILSVVSYDIDSTGDWLQLLAASAWFVANIVSLRSS